MTIAITIEVLNRVDQFRLRGVFGKPDYLACHASFTASKFFVADVNLTRRIVADKDCIELRDDPTLSQLSNFSRYLLTDLKRDRSAV